MIAIIIRAILLRPHLATPANLAKSIESQVTLSKQDVPGRTLSSMFSFVTNLFTVETMFNYVPTDDIPENSVNAGTDLSTGLPLFLPPGSSFQAEYQAGVNSGINGILTSDNASIMGEAIGIRGMFDFQRLPVGPVPSDVASAPVNGDMQNAAFYTGYTPSSNYGVGVYAEGAGLSLKDTLSYEAAYAAKMSTGANAIRISEITDGWNAAHNGAFNQ